MVELLLEVNHSGLQSRFVNLSIHILEHIIARAILLDICVLDRARELCQSRLYSERLGNAFAKLTIQGGDFEVLEALLIQLMELCLTY